MMVVLGLLAVLGRHLLVMLLVLWGFSSLRLRIGDHDAHTRVSSRHLSVLLEEPSVLHLWVTITELMLRLVVLSMTLALFLVLCVLLFFDHGLDLVILKLTVARVVLRIREGQDVAALV